MKKSYLKIIGISLLIGIGVGIGIKGFSSSSGGSGNEPLKLPGFSLLRSLFAPRFHVAGMQQDRQFILSNFESDEDLKLWTLNSAMIKPTTNHRTEGERGIEITFDTASGESAIKMEDYFEAREGIKNWKPYEYLAFDVYNPQSETERIILQVKDSKHGRYKQDLHVPAKQNKTFLIPIKSMSGAVDIKRVGSVTFFIWAPKVPRVFYLDHVRLVPWNFKKAEEASPLQSSALFQKLNAVTRPVKILDYGFVRQRPRWFAAGSKPESPVIRVPFIVKDESGVARSNWPAQGGIPFPQGEVSTVENIQIKDSQGKEVPFQGRVLATWPDKSIRWLQVDLQSNLNPMDGQGYFLEYGASVHSQAPDSPLKVEESETSYQVTTGPLFFTVHKKGFNLFEEVYLDANQNGAIEPSELIASKVPLSLQFRGKEYFSNFDQTTAQVTLEEKGPEKVALKATGWFQAQDGSRFCQWTARIHAFKNQSYLRIYHTFVYTGYPENKYFAKYKGLKLPENETIEEMSIRIPVQLEGPKTFTLGIEGENPRQFTEVTLFSFFQEDYKKNKITLNAETGGTLDRNALGWMDVSDQNKGITVSVRDFRKNFPKTYSFDAASNLISVDLWPKAAGELDLQTTADAYGPEALARGSAFGLAKTHELLFYFHAGSPQQAKSQEIALAFDKPLLVRVNPYWMDATGVLGRLYPRDPKYGKFEAGIDKLFEWAARQPRDFQWYGMLNYGDTLSWYRNEDPDNWYGDYGWHPVGRWGWYACEAMGLHSGSLIQYVRTGDWKYFDLGEASARHIMDVDTVHYNTIANDPRLKDILNDQLSRVGSMHRHNGNHWGGENDEASHTNVYGILLYYYLTGYERAFDVAKEIGEYFITQPITYAGHPDIAPNRAMGNAVWGDVQMYQATWDERYKKAADQLMEIYLAGQNSDGSFYENFDPVSASWNGKKHEIFMAYYAVPAFIAYHELTQDPQVYKALQGATLYLYSLSKEGHPSIVNGLSYLYLTSGDPNYLNMIDDTLNYFLAQQQHSGDSIMDGMIFKKPIYHRPVIFLYTMPFAFAALEESMNQPPPISQPGSQRR